MVDACNAAGINAAVLHQRPGFRVGWFDNNTRIAWAKHTRVTNRDVLVVSELDAPKLLAMAPSVTKVVINQAHFWTLTHGPVDYRHPDVAAVVSVSDDGVRYLRYAFPGLQPRRLRLGIDSVLFSPGIAERRPRILYAPTKGISVRRQVFKMLEQREALCGWEISAVTGLDQASLAALLRDSAIFASFSEFEGFQMLVTEAMAAGCAVVGYAAGGGREFLTESVAWPVPAGEVVGFAQRLEEVVCSWQEDRACVIGRTARARELVQGKYNADNASSDIVSALEPVLDRAVQQDGLASYALYRPPRSCLREVSGRVRGAARVLLRGLR